MQFLHHKALQFLSVAYFSFDRPSSDRFSLIFKQLTSFKKSVLGPTIRQEGVGDADIVSELGQRLCDFCFRIEGLESGE
jgi:hypothetical protein